MHELHYSACLLAEKAYRRNFSAYFLCESLQHAKRLNERLWHYAEDYFLPHQLYSGAPNSHIPMQIGYRTISTCPQAELLINMSGSVPAFYSQFTCVIELISNETKHRQAGREKYRHYQREGCKLLTQEVGIALDLPTHDPL
jgi:DNA polymerase-3 subunit chi